MSYKITGYRISETPVSEDKTTPEIQRNDFVYIPAGTWVYFITRKGYEDKQIKRGVIRKVYRVEMDGTNRLEVSHYQGGGQYQFWTVNAHKVFRAYPE